VEEENMDMGFGFEKTKLKQTKDMREREREREKNKSPKRKNVFPCLPLVSIKLFSSSLSLPPSLSIFSLSHIMHHTCMCHASIMVSTFGSSAGVLDTEVSREM
jgi:hypothetical protein